MYILSLERRKEMFIKRFKRDGQEKIERQNLDFEAGVKKSISFISFPRIAFR